jgi:hypothetical protein
MGSLHPSRHYSILLQLPHPNLAETVYMPRPPSWWYASHHHKVSLAAYLRGIHPFRVFLVVLDIGFNIGSDGRDYIWQSHN